MDRDEPFFDEKLLPSDRLGNFPEFTSYRRVKFFADRLEIDRRTVHFAYLTKLSALRDVLHVGYRTGDGTVVEEFFRYAALLKPGKSSQLRDAVERAQECIGLIPQAEREAATAGLPKEPVVATTVDPRGGRTSVEVRDPEVLFPLVCPKCGEEASTADVLYVSRGVGEKGSWVIPVCEEHPRLADTVRLAKWSAVVTGYEFSFSNPDYAEAFRRVNQMEGAGAGPASSRLAVELDRGVRFVVFQYAVSALVFSMITTSKLHRLEPGTSAARAGWPYTLGTVLLGWWSIFGPLMTVRAIRANLRGGIDLTPRVTALVEGRRTAAHEMA